MRRASASSSMTMTASDPGVRRLTGDMCGVDYQSERLMGDWRRTVATFLPGAVTVTMLGPEFSGGVLSMARPASIARGAWLIVLALSITLFTTLGAQQPPAAPAGQPPAAPAGRGDQPAQPAAPAPKPL